MAKTEKKGPKEKDPQLEIKILKTKKQYRMLFGFLLVLLSIGFLVSFISFFVTGQADQSAVNSLTDRSETVENWLGKFGAYIADLFVYRGFGVASFLFVKLFFLSGAFLLLDLPIKKLKNTWFWDLFAIIIISITFGFFATSLPELGGTIGYEMNQFIQDYIGKIGTLLGIVFALVIYLIFKIKISPEAIKTFFENKKAAVKEDLNGLTASETDNGTSYILEEFAVAEIEEELEEPTLKTSQFEINKDSLKPTIENGSEINLEPTIKTVNTPILNQPQIIETNDEAFVIEKVAPWYPDLVECLEENKPNDRPDHFDTTLRQFAKIMLEAPVSL
jgi:S-DNA-T family DNA segregation ATPase FtsK/SpoIIIE